MKRVFKILICFLSLILNGYAQTITVVSNKDKQTIPQVRFDIKHNNAVYNYRSNYNGQLKIENQFYKQSLDVDISYSGYNSIQLKNIKFYRDTTIVLISEITEFNEVVVTAQYKSQLIDNAVHNIKVIDRKQLELMAAQNVKEALTNELNIHLMEDNILGSSLQLQGIGGENVKILIDGVPLTGRQNGNIDLSQIQIENIERIEIVEGPLSVSYGTDALAGTINIITKKRQDKQLEATINNYFESNGKANNHISLGWNHKEHLIRLDAGRQFFDGWDPSHSTFHFKKPVADSTRFMQWKPKIQLFNGLNYVYRRNNSSFNYSGDYLNEKITNRGRPRKPYFETAFDDYYQTERINQRLNFDYRFKNTYRISILGGYSAYIRKKNTKVRDLTNISDILSTDPNDHDTSQFHNFSLRARWLQSNEDKKFNYEVGFDLQHELTAGKKIFNNKQTIGDYALFITSEYSPISVLTIRPGIRYGYNTNYKTPLTPSLNIKYNVSNRADQQITLRGSYAKGFRSPSIKELHYTFIDINHYIVGNENLEAETSDNYSLSIQQNKQFKIPGFRNKLMLFYNDIKNMITLAQSSLTEYSYFNLNRFSTVGAKLESNLNYKKLSTGAGVAVIGRYNSVNSDDNYKFRDFLMSPEVNFNLKYDWEKPDIQFALFYKYNGRLPQIINNELGEFKLATIEDYQIADLRLTKSFWNKKLQLSLGIKNLFNVISVAGSQGNAIEAHSSGSGMVSIGTGRTFNFGLKLNLTSK